MQERNPYLCNGANRSFSWLSGSARPCNSKGYRNCVVCYEIEQFELCVIL